VLEELRWRRRNKAEAPIALRKGSSYGRLVAVRDRDIRRCLRAQLESEHKGDDDTLILDELGLLQGAARVDMAVVNGAIAAWEIKSERDTLRRLATQAEAYCQVFDYVTLVAAPDHIRKIKSDVPTWWGISVAVLDENGEVRIKPRRAPKPNPGTDSKAVAKLLWRSEALAALEARGLDIGLRSKPRGALWNALAENVSASELAAEVRAALKARRDWRVAPPPP
jgi:hypothetical protein